MKTQLYVSNDNDDKITKKLFIHDGFFGDQNSDLTLEKANFLCYINQATMSPLKNNQEAIYQTNVALAQLLPLVNSPPDIENYVCKENKVKLLCSKYDTETGQFWGIEKRLAAISVKGDEDEVFLSYVFNKEKSKVSFSSHKMCLPNIFQSTYFKKHKDYLKSDDKGESSTLFCYLPSTTDRKELVNQFKNNVQLHPIDCSYEKFREFSSSGSNFFPHHLDSDDKKEHKVAREIVVNFMKHIVNISNANLKRNRNCLVLNGNVSSETPIIGMEVRSKRFKLSY